MVNKKKSVQKNYILNLINQLLGIIIPLILVPYISRVLQPEGVGKYSFVSSIITYFTLFASLGFGYYAQREIAKYQDDKEQQAKVFWEIFILRCFSVGLSLVVNLLFVSIGVYGNNALFMIILSLNIISIMIDASYLFQGNEEFGKIVSRNIIAKLSMTILIFVLVKTPDDLWLYILLHSLMTLLGNILLWPSIIKWLPKVHFSELTPFRHTKQVVLLALPAMATSIYTVLDKTLIGVITGSDAQNGFYEQAEKIVKCALTVITCLDLVMIPRNTTAFEKGNQENLKQNVYKTFHFVWILGIPMTLGMMVVASNFIPWYLGESFIDAIILLQIISPIILIIGCSNVLGSQYLIPTKRDKLFTISIVSGAVINLVFNLILIQYFQALGAVISTVIAEFTIVAVMYFVVRKELKLSQILKTAIKPLIAGLIMVVVIGFLNTVLNISILSTIILVIVGIVVYGLTLLIIRDKMILETISEIKKKFTNKRRKIEE